MARLLIDTLAHYRREQKFLIHEFVVLPNHFHLLLTPLNIPLAKAVQFIKGGFSHRVRKELGVGCEVWERGYVGIMEFEMQMAAASDNFAPKTSSHFFESLLVWKFDGHRCHRYP